MIKKIVIILITTLTLTVNVSAASDGELLMKKNDPTEVKDCFEKVNRATFAFNKAIDGIKNSALWYQKNMLRFKKQLTKI